jgi:hypothetical protein
MAFADLRDLGQEAALDDAARGVAGMISPSGDR